MTAALATQPGLREIARARFDANCCALGVAMAFPELAYCHARDGSLTAKVDGRWLGGCSVPRRAGELMAKPVNARGQVVGLLLPSTAQQITAVLDHLSPAQAVIALLPSIDALPAYLACGDFEAAVRSHRLSFTDEASLLNFYESHPGLPSAAQLVRLADAPADRVEALLRSTQLALSDVSAAHARRAAAARETWSVAREGIIVLSAQRFELWNDAGFTLAEIANGETINTETIDTGDALTASTALLAERAAGHAAIVMTGVGRADRPDLSHPNQPWITWITEPRVPAYLPTSPRDGLLLADESLIPPARAAGWPVDRIAVAAWPVEAATCKPNAPLALIVDLPDLKPPTEVTEYSSWRVVWDAVLDELRKHPLALGDDPQRYLDRALVRLQLPADKFPAAVFLDRLLPAAFMIGIAHVLVQEKVPLVIHGRGWESVETLSPFLRGPVESRDDWRNAIASVSGIIDVFVTRAAHPMRSLAMPRLRPLGMTRQRLLTDARAMLTGRSPAAPVPNRILSRDAIDTLLQA